MGGERSILVVEDDLSLRRRLAALLRASGYRATAVEPAAALGAIAGETPALVILDTSPSGLAVCRALRDRPRLRRLPLLLIASMGASEVAAVVGSRSAWGYLARPFAPGDLLVAVRHFMAG